MGRPFVNLRAMWPLMVRHGAGRMGGEDYIWAAMALDLANWMSVMAQVAPRCTRPRSRRSKCQLGPPRQQSAKCYLLAQSQEFHKPGITRVLLANFRPQLRS